MKKKRSIHDIARELGVSATTISFVLKGGELGKKVSEPVKQRILNHIETIGYKPNPIAQNLRTGKSKIIGMLVEDISDPFFSAIGRIIEDSLYKSGYKIFYASTDNDTEKAKNLLQLFRERQVDGYIIAPTPGIQKEILELLHESKPVIVFDRYYPDLPTANVVADNLGGIMMATRHLIDNGYSNICFVTLKSDQIQMNDRLEGFFNVVKSTGIHHSILKIDYKTTPDEAADQIRCFLEKNQETDAVLFATNYLALSGLKALQDLRFSIPHTLGIVGFDDCPHYSLFKPSITAVAQPIQNISQKVADLLRDALVNGKTILPNQTYVIPTEIIVRESSINTRIINKSFIKQKFQS